MKRTFHSLLVLTALGVTLSAGTSPVLAGGFGVSRGPSRQMQAMPQHQFAARPMAQQFGQAMNGQLAAPQGAPVQAGAPQSAPQIAGPQGNPGLGGPQAVAPQQSPAIVNPLQGNVAKILPRGFGGAPHHMQGGQPAIGGMVAKNFAPRAHCGHVIELLLRNCGPQPMIIGPAIGDLELVSVALVAEGSLEAGPLFAITFRNNSPNNLDGFHISLVGVLGEIEGTSPAVTAQVKELAAGAEGVMEIQLPVTSMAMSRDGQTLEPFETLVVAIDSYDELVESNEPNNISTLSRGEIPLVVAEAVVEAPAEAAPVEEVAPPTGEEGPPAPSEVNPVAPTDRIDFDSLDLGDEADAASLFSR